MPRSTPNPSHFHVHSSEQFSGRAHDQPRTVITVGAPPPPPYGTHTPHAVGASQSTGPQARSFNSTFGANPHGLFSSRQAVAHGSSRPVLLSQRAVHTQAHSPVPQSQRAVHTQAHSPVSQSQHAVHTQGHSPVPQSQRAADTHGHQSQEHRHNTTRGR
jgi:hypothetical protein